MSVKIRHVAARGCRVAAVWLIHRALHLKFDDESPQPQNVQAFSHNVPSTIAVYCRVVHDGLRRHGSRHSAVTHGNHLAAGTLLRREAD